MALFAETLVDEWLNRQGFFTVRGVKDGVDEIDVLGVRPTSGGLEAWHVEVQVSFRPVGYISPLTDELAVKVNKKKTSAWERPREMLEECVIAWVRRKFTAASKQAARNRSWPKVQWQCHFVHGVVREPAELSLIEAQGIKLVPFHQILSVLCGIDGTGVRGAAGTDIAEIVAYYEAAVRSNKARPLTGVA